MTATDGKTTPKSTCGAMAVTVDAADSRRPLGRKKWRRDLLARFPVRL
jgi:hypothetical protein